MADVHLTSVRFFSFKVSWLLISLYSFYFNLWSSYAVSFFSLSRTQITLYKCSLGVSLSGLPVCVLYTHVSTPGGVEPAIPTLFRQQSCWLFFLHFPLYWKAFKICPKKSLKTFDRNRWIHLQDDYNELATLIGTEKRKVIMDIRSWPGPGP